MKKLMNESKKSINSSMTIERSSLGRASTPGFKDTIKSMEKNFMKEFLVEFENNNKQRLERENQRKSSKVGKKAVNQSMQSKTQTGFNIKSKTNMTKSIGNKKQSKQEFKGKLKYFEPTKK